MLVVYFFIGLIVLLAVWFISFSYKRRKSQEFAKEKEKPEDKDETMYR